MVKIRKLESQIRNGRVVKTWSNFFGLIVVTVESETPLNIGRIANSVSPQGHNPHLMILFNPRENHYTIIPNRIMMKEPSVLKMLRGLENDLNRNDETAIYGGTKWKIDTQKGILHSPNHGFESSLTTKEILLVVGMKQYFREIKRMRNIVLLPLPGQVETTLRKRNAKEAGEIVSNAMPAEFRGTYEVSDKGVKIRFKGSL